MLACLLGVLLLGASFSPASAPAGVVTASGPLTGLKWNTRTQYMLCDGRERAFYVPEGAKITINGKPNRTFRDLNGFSMGRKPRGRITIISDGISQQVELIVIHD